MYIILRFWCKVVYNHLMTQGYISDMIESGIVSNFDGIINYLGMKWKKRWGSKNPVIDN